MSEGDAVSSDDESRMRADEGGDECEHLKDAVRRLLRATTPFPSALEGDPFDFDVDLEQIWNELAGMVGYDPSGDEAGKP